MNQYSVNLIETINMNPIVAVVIKRECVDDICLHKNTDNQFDILQMFPPSGCNYSLGNVVNNS